ncbi:TOBE domain-containing protein [Bradyrhizobium yuanmingense]|uniref:TOBE domain-containing protein n=1 Tax=Bradyrhizobium yuanmingense TaxID=108015 RepID=UPI003B967DF0
MRICGIDQRADDGNNVLNGKVASSSFCGGMTRVTVDTENGLKITAKLVSDRSESRPAPGTSVRLCWSPSDGVVLEK